MSPGPVVVQPVASGRDLNEFVALPKRLYRGRKGYIAPLDLERKETLSRKKNPYFQHAEGELFVARRAGEVVGRISAQFCRLHQEKYRNDTGDQATYHAVGSSRMLDKVRSDGRIRLRPLDMKNYKPDLAALLQVFNDAWSENWEMVPFSQSEIEAAAASMKPLIDPDLVVIAEIDNEVAGMLVCLPNLLEAVRDLNGGLLPFGFAKLLWRLKRKTLKTARVPLMGIRRKYHGTLTGAALLPLMFHRLKDPFLARGLEQVELSWILEDNVPMRRVLEGVGAKVYKTYRIYEKAIA